MNPARLPYKWGLEYVDCIPWRGLKVWIGLGWAYGILTIVGYLMPNPFYEYVLNVYDL